ncbi:hypothetical protein D9O36_12050 [Zobellia amurskyensis]|uniref:Uncharacterized protein n=1 Tax=Zobellia amurskyensis TaxID=248905 RepID=A0A7X3D2K4_9FLAO|nr:hypothetical protein [Zobellia amurskyensis]MUH36576.1 hypothetical protein [Zobellia amurskyensis]
MQSKKENFSRSTKPTLIKYVALIIALCYVINPLHQKISTVFHEVSHVLEMPDSVIGHDYSIHENNTHYTHHHTDVDRHEHNFINIIDAIFDASGTNKSQEGSRLADFKFDKHITTTCPEFHLIPAVRSLENFKSIESNLKLGHFTILEEPPQQTNLPISC